MGIAKKEVHDTIIDLVNWKWLSIESENVKPVDVSAMGIDKVAKEEEYADSHYMWSNWVFILGWTSHKHRVSFQNISPKGG